MKKWRLLVLVSVGILLIAGALGYRHFWLSLPVGRGPAGPAVPPNAFAEVWTTRKVLLLGLGDSITAGYGVDQDHSYFGRLVENPDDELPDMQGICLSAVLPNLQTKNMAVSGSTSIGHLDLLHREFLGHGIHCRQPWREHYRPEDPHYWYAENLEDPNIRGYDAIRRLFLIEMAKVADELGAEVPEEAVTNHGT